jgi:NMD protein affecting ribosome stability and mRNA decay
MRSVKRYSNVTFTKRVDHDGGEHRPPTGLPEPALCPGCGAVYAKKRWALRGDAQALPGTPIAVRICSSCRRRRSGVPHGYVHIDGEFFATHRAEMEALLHHEVEHARRDNHLNQVMAWEDDGTGGLLITTASEHLAQRLGHTLEKAYDGQVHYGFSHENKLAHVWWHR